MPSGVYQSVNRCGGKKGRSGVYKKSIEHRIKISKTLKIKGIKPPIIFGKRPWLKKHRSEETKKKISLGMIGKNSGENHPRWIKDRTKLVRRNRSDIQSNIWRKQIFNRDGFQCKMCGKNKYIQAHHILPWRDYPELRYNINNGITLCLAHHPRKRAEEKRLIPYFQKLVGIGNSVSIK